MINSRNCLSFSILSKDWLIILSYWISLTIWAYLCLIYSLDSWKIFSVKIETNDFISLTSKIISYEFTKADNELWHFICYFDCFYTSITKFCFNCSNYCCDFILKKDSFTNCLAFFSYYPQILFFIELISILNKCLYELSKLGKELLFITYT